MRVVMRGRGVGWVGRCVVVQAAAKDRKSRHQMAQSVIPCIMLSGVCCVYVCGLAAVGHREQWQNLGTAARFRLFNTHTITKYVSREQRNRTHRAAAWLWAL